MQLRKLIICAVLVCTTGRSFAEERDITIPVRASGPEIKMTEGGKYDFQVPDQKIVAPDTVDPGEMVMANVSNITNPPNYLVAATYKWKVLENGIPKKNIKEWPDGTSVIFGAGVLRQGETSRKFTIIVSVAYLYLAKEKDVVASVGQRSVLLTAEVVMAGSGPAPLPPGPGPNPNPFPPGPDGKYGLTNKVYNLVMTTVPANSRVQGSKVLANAFSGISASVAAGTLTDIRSLLQQSKMANQTALANASISAADWDQFFTSLQREIYPLYSGGKLSGVRDFADAFREIAAGLEKVK